MMTIRCISDKAKTPNVYHTLLVGEKYSIGRKGGDISFPEDQSISRNHAEIVVDHPPPNVSDPLLIPTLVLTDLGSKFGTFTNEGIERRCQISMRDPLNLSPGDRFRFGLQWNEFKIEYTPLVVTPSTLKDQPALKHIIMTLGGHMVREWSDKCHYVVMDVLTLTIKVVCALLAAKHIVTPAFFNDLYECVKTKKGHPNPASFLPPFGEAILKRDGLSLLPDVRRTQLFEGKTFLFSNQKELSKLGCTIQSGGGTSALIATASKSDLQKENFIIMKPKQEYSMLDSQTQKALEIYKKANKRMIQDSEIGLAAVYITTAIHCNPVANFVETNLPKLGSQTQQTQASSERTENSARVVVPETQNIPTQISVTSQSVNVVEDSEPIVKQEPKSEKEKDPVNSASSSKLPKRDLTGNEDAPASKKRLADESLIPNASGNKRLRSGGAVESEKALSSLFGLSDSDSEEDTVPETLPEVLNRSEESELSYEVVARSNDLTPQLINIVPDSPEPEILSTSVGTGMGAGPSTFQVPATPEPPQRRVTRAREITEGSGMSQTSIQPSSSSSKRKLRSSDESPGPSLQTQNSKKRKTKTDITDTVVDEVKNSIADTLVSDPENNDLTDLTEQLTIQTVKSEPDPDGKIKPFFVPVKICSLLKKPKGEPEVQVVNGVNVKNFKTFRKVLPLTQQNNGGSTRSSGNSFSGRKLTFEAFDYSPNVLDTSYGPTSPKADRLRCRTEPSRASIDFENLQSTSTTRTAPIRSSRRNGTREVTAPGSKEPDIIQNENRQEAIPPPVSSDFEEEEEDKEDDIWGFN